MTVLLQQFILSSENEIVNQFCEDEEIPYYHFNFKAAAKELKLFKCSKNKSRASFERLLGHHGLSNLEKSLQQSSCKDVYFENLLQRAIKNNKILAQKNSASRSLSRKFKRERKQLTKFKKCYFLMTDLEKIAIGRGKELPNLSVELIVQLSTLTNQN
ncbi:hypothetical protein M0812_20607 [Anaeramoeba flamelloides]|uniref:Uncharacterized protein n=1 Tax=Anaeramoeba flamelloides TaxID=1746091 RepID=A0AAV7YS91_9EUKA|nr:hypothetical protein M0812_20607 [Anaeramoeba flamelloides]